MDISGKCITFAYTKRNTSQVSNTDSRNGELTITILTSVLVVLYNMFFLVSEIWSFVILLVVIRGVLFLLLHYIIFIIFQNIFDTHLHNIFLFILQNILIILLNMILHILIFNILHLKMNNLL